MDEKEIKEQEQWMQVTECLEAYGHSGKCRRMTLDKYFASTEGKKLLVINDIIERDLDMYTSEGRKRIRCENTRATEKMHETIEYLAAKGIETELIEGKEIYQLLDCAGFKSITELMGKDVKTGVTSIVENGLKNQYFGAIYFKGSEFQGRHGTQDCYQALTKILGRDKTIYPFINGFEANSKSGTVYMR